MNAEDMNDEQLNKALGLEWLAKAKAEKKLKELQEEWKRRHGKDVGTEHNEGGVKVHLGINRRWDESTARKRLSRVKNGAYVISQLEVTKLDSAAAKRMLPPAIYEECGKVHGTKFMVGFGE